VTNLEPYADDQDPEVRESWRIETVQSADWALLRLAECEQDEAAIRAQADTAIARIKTRADRLVAKAQRGAAFFGFKLLEYAQSHRDQILKGKAKSHDYLHGRIGWRKKGDRLKVVDAHALAEWCRTQPGEFYRIKIEPEMKAIQERAKKDGLIPPGCEWEAERDEPYIEAVAPETAITKKEE